ncbi:MAG TPA: hypothetical protein V6C97_16770 [Oculatellaceae cyanobacterium]
MNHADPELLEKSETIDQVFQAEGSNTICDTTAYDTSAITVGDGVPSEADELVEVEQLPISQAATILGIPEERVRELIADNTLCCAQVDEGSVDTEPRLSAACVRAQAGKSKLEFIQEVKRLIAGENKKHRKTSVDLPSEADMCLQDLFDNASTFKEADRVSTPRPTHQLHVRGINRSEITSRSIENLLENLDFTSVRLEGAMYRIGYLEAKLDDLQTEMQIMPELKAKWAQALILERENEDFKALIEEQQQSLADQTDTIAEYKDTIGKREQELLGLHQLVDKIKNSWWCRMWCWLTGVTLR